MKRTQLYLEDRDWDVLQVRARQSGLTVSELVRRAVRETYRPELDRRKKAMKALVGLRKDRTDLPPTDEYIRQLRSGHRLDRLMKQWES